MQIVSQINTAVDFLKEKGVEIPEVGIILGTGLGAIADGIVVEKEFDYADIPHFPVATVEFHKGKLIYGELGGKKVIAMQGRFHYYEGYSLAEVVFPVRVMYRLGIQKLIISNVSGCMNLDWEKGELMLLEDHINLLPDNPLRGQEATAFGQPFTDMSQPYDKEMNKKFLDIASELGIKLNKGVYVAVIGPSLETKAEYKFLRLIGADVVGMSTVPEVISANQMGLPVVAISVITDICDPENLQPINIEDIIKTSKVAEKNLMILMNTLIKRL